MPTSSRMKKLSDRSSRHDAPVEARQAVVGAEGRRRDDRDGEQQDEPDREAHGSGRPGSRSIGRDGSERGEGVVGPHRRRLARLLLDLAQQLERDLRAPRRAIEVALDRALAPSAGRLRAASNWRASSDRRALSRRSLTFSLRKNAWSGATSIASGWSIARDANERADLRPGAVDDRAPGVGRTRATASRPEPLADAGADAGRRGAAAALARQVAPRLGRREQRQLVDQAHRLVELDRERGDVGDARRLDPVEVARDGAAHRLEARLVGAREALVDLLQRGDHRLGTAGERRSAAGRRARSPRCRRPGSRRASGRPTGPAPRAGRAARATSLRRASSSATLAAASRAPSCAWRASSAASVTWSGAFLLALDQLALAAAHALVGAPGEDDGDDRKQGEHQDRERRGAQRARAGRSTASPAAGRGEAREARENGRERRRREARRLARNRRSRLRSIVCRRPPRRARAPPRRRCRSRGCARARRCADGSPPRAPPRQRPAPAACSRLAIASELLNSQTRVARRRARRRGGRVRRRRSAARAAGRRSPRRPRRRPRRGARRASRGRRRRGRRGRCAPRQSRPCSRAQSDSESNCGASAAGRDDRRGRHAGVAQRLGGARCPARRRAAPSGQASAGRPRGEEVQHRVGADEDDQSARRQARPTPRAGGRVGGRRDLDQRQRLGVDAALRAAARPRARPARPAA